MLRLLLVVFCATALFSTNYAQITDNFSDGDFAQNPAWTGDAANFIVNAAGELQLNAPVAGTSVLLVGGEIADSAVWLLDFRLEFAPSAGNLLRIYLQADQADLTLANGYLIEIGENGSADALRFFRQDGGAKTLLASGTAGLVAGDPVALRLRVRRSAAGDWEAGANDGSGSGFQPEFAVTDATYPGGPALFFGFQCVYTATRVDKFFFDNISILPDVPDTAPPVLLSAQATDAVSVTAVFDETVDLVSATDPANFSISGIGAPADVEAVAGNPRAVRLILASPLPTGNYQLQCDQIADTLGNTGGPQTAGFAFLLLENAALFDLVINEIMADPTPVFGLPDAEWVELYNRSGKYIDLQTLRFGKSTGTQTPLPAYVLAPDSFVVFCASSAFAAMNAVTPNVLAVPNFPALINTTDWLILDNAQGEVIAQIVYNVDWHTDENKADGGWTLERINPNLPCLGAANWQSCPALPGGTPGRANASLDLTPDLTAPQMTGVLILDETTLELHFSEGLDLATAGQPAAYVLSPPVPVAAAAVPGDDRSVVRLTLGSALSAGILYGVSVTPALLDCSGNAASDADTVRIGLPEMADPQDIVINEILFNPVSFSFDYVELYNRSDRIFDLEELVLGNSRSTGLRPVTAQGLFLPGQYLVFTENRNDVLNRYAGVRADWVLSQDLPSLDDSQDTLVLLWTRDAQLVVVDSLQYSDNWHNALLTSNSDREGVALERIRPGGPTNAPANWTSAASVAGQAAGTPTRPNSQNAAEPTRDGGLVHLPVARISPFPDNREDYLDIVYHLPESGYSATATIYDAGGIPIKHLVRQDLIGTEGALRWDGDLDDGTIARPGIHILFVELFAPTGEVRQVKKVFAVVDSF